MKPSKIRRYTDIKTAFSGALICAFALLRVIRLLLVFLLRTRKENGVTGPRTVNVA